MEPHDQVHHTHGGSSLLGLDRDLVHGARADQQGPDQREPVSAAVDAFKTPLDTSTNTTTAGPSSRTSSTASLSTPSPSARFSTTPRSPRSYRRPLDHHSHHHHGSIHGSGHSSGQSSSGMGVRSAFKDFVVPIQIILVCSIFNALWPSLLRIIATTVEFLVLVLSSYSACARRSDNCYFLEPLFNDGQEGVYLGTIQWTLRGVFCILFLSGVYMAGKKASKIWSALTSTRRRRRGLQGPDGLCPWLMTYPSWIWRYFARIFPWRITRSHGQSGRVRSVEGTRHQRKTSGAQSSAHSSEQHPSSGSKGRSAPTASHNTPTPSKKIGAIDTDATSAGSGSESKARSRTKARRSKVIEDVLPRDNPSREAGSNSTLQNQSSSSHSNSTSEPTTPTLSSEPSLSSAVTTATPTTRNGNPTIADTSSNAVYKAVDDGDFIPTDRRRRKKAKGHKINPAAASSESLIKDQEPSPNVASPPQPTPPISPALESPKASVLSGTPAPFRKPSEEVAAQHKQTPALEQRQPQSSTKSMDNAHISPRNTTIASSLVKENSLPPQRDNTDNTFVHPIHALNSSSPIVRLKPSHKRSQSAQLPPPTPWSIPPPPSSANSKKTNHGTSLNKVTLSDGFIDPTATAKEATLNIAKDTTVVVPSNADQSSVDRLATNSSPTKDYDVSNQSSSIWYSPFQSGLDISIEGDQGHGKQGSRPLSKPKIQIDASGAQQRSTLAPLLTPCSFFESSPRAPRIMPFSQHHSGNTLGLEDWSAQNGLSSAIASMTPSAESDPLDPIACLGGSRSVSNSRRGSVENNLTESLLSGKARMFASSEPSIGIHLASQHSSGSAENISESLSEGIFLVPHYGSSIAPTTSASFVTPGSSALGHASLEPSSSTVNMFMDTEVDTIRTFVNPWESKFSYQSTHAMSDTFLPFGPPSTTSSTDNIDRDRQYSLLRLMNADKRMDGPMPGATLFGSREFDNEKEAVRRGFLFPSLAHHSQTAVHSNADLSGFHPFVSVEMSLAAAANQPPPFVGDLKYDHANLSLQDLVSQPAVTLESSPVLARMETSEKKSKNQHRHGRTRSGHHKSASLSSFFPPLPPAPGASDNSSSGSQAVGETRSLDPLNRLSFNGGGEGRHHGNHGHGRHGRNSQGPGSSKEADGSSSTAPRRRVGTDQESQPRGSSKQRHHDSSKSKKVPKRV